MSPYQDALDTQPGPVPEIRADADGLTFVMRPRGISKIERLVIRCDESGNIWIAIAGRDAAGRSPKLPE